MYPINLTLRSISIIVYSIAMRKKTRFERLTKRKLIRLLRITTKMFNRMAKRVGRDPLTDLYNREELFKMLEHEIVRARKFNHPLSIAIIDLDNFKVINDRFGHLTGDAALRVLAKVLKRTFGKEDILARYGGDEFVVIVPELSAEKILQPLEKIRDKIESTRHNLEGHHCRFSISVGVAGLPSSGDISAKDMLEHADKALLKAKEKGRNRIEAY
jgi:diguanylate cyclase (GGDEF)-like protein